MEPKKDLIERVVRVIGKKKAIELLSETATIEQNGGLYTVVCTKLSHKFNQFQYIKLEFGTVNFASLLLFGVSPVSNVLFSLSSF